MKTKTLSPEPLHKTDAYWRAAYYLSVGQMYLYDNPLLKEALKLSDVKALVVGHRCTIPGQNVIDVHLNRATRGMSSTFSPVAGLGRSHSQNPLMKKDKQCQELHSHRNSADVWRGIVRK